MRVVRHACLPVDDAARRALYAQHPSPGAPGALRTGAEAYPGGHFGSEADLARRLAWLDARPRPEDLAGFLRHENAFAPLTPEQRANLEAAADPRAVFILTGQQPGLLGGPILWYYKALTCAALARDCAGRLGRPVIPIFWVAGDDSDLAECNHVEIPGAAGAAAAGPLRLPFHDADRPLAMGERRVDPDALADLLRRLTAVWDAETVEALGRAYPAPSTLASGFLRLAQAQLGREGILFVDGYSRHLRARARPVLERAVRDWRAWQAALERGTAAAAAAGIPIQVEPRPHAVHAFILRDGERHRLFAQDEPGKGPGGAGAGGRDASSQAPGGRLYEQARPGRDLGGSLEILELTHDVFSRPLAADSLFPVLGHVLGPAELRYFAQLSPLFLETTGDMPLLQPRMSAVVAPASARAAFAAEGVDISDALRYGAAALRNRLADRVWERHPARAALESATADRWLDGLRAAHERHFRDEGPLARLERSTEAAWKRYRHGLQRAAYAAAAPGFDALFAHLRKLGNGSGQDRHLGLGSLLHDLGRSGFRALREALDPLERGLQFIEFDDGEEG